MIFQPQIVGAKSPEFVNLYFEFRELPNIENGNFSIEIPSKYILPSNDVRELCLSISFIADMKYNNYETSKVSYGGFPAYSSSNGSGQTYRTRIKGAIYIPGGGRSGSLGFNAFINKDENIIEFRKQDSDITIYGFSTDLWIGFLAHVKE